MTRASDPGRLSDATPESPLGRLLASAERDVPSDQELAKLADRLGGVLDPTHVPTVASGSSLLAKVGAAAGVAALVAGGLWVSHRPHAASPAPSIASSASAITTVQDVTHAPIAAVPSSSSSASIAEPTPKPAVLQKPGAELLKSGSTAAEGPSEPVLLEQARRALVGSPATALALTNQHAARFPHGVLTQESEVIAIEALRRLGRSADADRRAAAFDRAFPGSAHQRMVEDASPK